MNLKKENILVVDDDYDMLELIQRNLKTWNFHTYRASSVAEALEILASTPIGLVVTDLQMPGANGIELVKYMREHHPDIPKLVITGFPSVDSAVDTVKSGALDYLIKPFTTDELKTAIHNALPASSISTPEKPHIEIFSYGGMVGQSAQFRSMIEVIERVKDNRATILIQGESGTGKELVARAIHYNGKFASKPFIAVNCAAIPENLLEAELFGFVKGSFTGANESREGLFQAADGGTIFLDEIGDAPQSVQTSLLRVLQEKEVSMIGSRQKQKIEVRVIAATNADLKTMVEQGTFREDLYFRLNVVGIDTLPLRERKEDILPIFEILLKKYALEYNSSIPTVSPEAIEIIKRHSWPGNIRELENVVQRLIIMSNGEITVADLPVSLKYIIDGPKGGFKSLKEVEKEYILSVLESVGNNKSKAAEILQIDRKTLRSKLSDT